MATKVAKTQLRQKITTHAGRTINAKEYGRHSFIEVSRQATPASHAYVALLGLKPSATSSLVQQIQTGFPFSSLESFQQAFGLSFVKAAELLGIPQRTLIRRKEQGHLGSDESERLLRFARLLGAAIELFEGDEEEARRWLQTSKRALGDVTPLEMARTELGAREVENLIGRLEHGVYS